MWNTAERLCFIRTLSVSGFPSSPDSLPFLPLKVSGQAVVRGEHLRRGDLREAAWSHPEAGADLQAQCGGDGRRPSGRPARHRRVPVPVP